LTRSDNSRGYDLCGLDSKSEGKGASLRTMTILPITRNEWPDRKQYEFIVCKMRDCAINVGKLSQIVVYCITIESVSDGK
jgi:hypothetical protein